MKGEERRVQETTGEERRVYVGIRRVEYRRARYWRGMEGKVKRVYERRGSDRRGECRRGEEYEEMRVQERKGEESICGEEKRVLEMKGGGGECDIGE